MINDSVKQSICNSIKSKFPDIYLEVENLPKAFIGKSKIKAIVLGCDPSNLSNKKFEFVFGLENINSQYFRGVRNNLRLLNLTVDDIYVQNVIQNYFSVETSKNKYWRESALLWLDYLNKELDNKYGKDIPVLVTSWQILNLLIPKALLKQYPTNKIYTDNKIFNEVENILNRNVICMFRHQKYLLKNYSNYSETIRNLIISLHTK